MTICAKVFDSETMERSSRTECLIINIVMNNPLMEVTIDTDGRQKPFLLFFFKDLIILTENKTEDTR